eukprot:SAG11_NODE_19772_length_459_cov_0.719444_1_plen_112_part_01
MLARVTSSGIRRRAFVWDLAGFLPPSNTTQLVAAGKGIIGGLAERAYGESASRNQCGVNTDPPRSRDAVYHCAVHAARELGVIDGSAAHGSDEERRQVRAYIDGFAIGCIER